MYRTSPDSPIYEALIHAARRGKQVAAILELTARFDEANNLEWAKRLADAGVHVAYGSPTRKIHSKICLVVRDAGDAVRLYCHIGTGNYNSRTARIYEDLGLFTANPAICADLVRVFNHLTGVADPLETTTLLVAPVSLRPGIEQRIEREIEHARAGRPAHIVLKLNALEDFTMTQLLYRAAEAGVQVDLVVRGICRLKTHRTPGGDRIRVVSVIGRFLEHSRVYYFGNDGNPEWYIGSADLMKRNLDERVEVVTPVTDAAHRERLRVLLNTLLDDERQGWRLHGDTWHRDQESNALGTHQRLLREFGAVALARVADDAGIVQQGTDLEARTRA
jgi:polyphosphate kinase